MNEGLLCVLTQPTAGDEPEFHDWYDRVHVPDRLRIPGVESARRYQLDDDRQPEWLALYDLNQLDVLERPDYRALRLHRSAHEELVMSRLQVLDRRIYQVISARGAPAHDGSPVLLANWMTPRPNDVEQFHSWYENEHIPQLLAIPGWLRVRRFQLVEGGGPRFLALHDLADANVLNDPRRADAAATPRRNQVVGQLLEHDRRCYRLRRNSPPGEGEEAS